MPYPFRCCYSLFLDLLFIYSLFFAGVSPILLKNVEVAFEIKPQHPISRGNMSVDMSSLVHCSRRSSYFSNFRRCAQSMLVSKGIVNSVMITFFELTDQMTRSGGCRVDVVSVGKASCMSRSAITRKSVQPSSNVGLCLLFLCGVSKRFFLWQIVYLSLYMKFHVIVLSLVFSHLVHASCLGCATAMARRLLSSKSWISSEIILSTTTLVGEDQIRLSQLPQCRLHLSFWGKILPSPLHVSRSIFNLLLWHVVHFSPVGLQNHVIFGTVVLYPFKLLNKWVLVVSVSLMNCIKQRLLRI